MLGQLTYCAHIGFLITFREPAQLKSVDHSLSEFGHSYTSRLEFGQIHSVVDRFPKRE